MRETSRREFLTGAGALVAAAALGAKERLGRHEKGESSESPDAVQSPPTPPQSRIERPPSPEEILLRTAAERPEQFIARHGLLAHLEYRGNAEKQFLALVEKERQARFGGKDAEHPDRFFAHATPETVQMIFRACEKYRVPAGIGLGIALAESRCKPDANSSKGAVGVMQLMPDTARGLGLRVEKARDERMDPEKCVYAGVRYMAELEAAFLRWDTALIAYNWGRGNLKNLIEKMRTENPKRPRTYLTMRTHLPDEARNYVPRVEGYAREWAQWMHARETASAAR